MWFRIELNKDGSVASCEEVESRGTDGRLVVFVDADTKTNALREAFEWRQRFIAKYRANSIRRNAEKKAKGECHDCQRPAEPGKVRCRLCAEIVNTKKRNRLAEQQGAHPEPLPSDARPPTGAERRELALLYRIYNAIAKDPKVALHVIREEIAKREQACALRISSVPGSTDELSFVCSQLGVTLQELQNAPRGDQRRIEVAVELLQRHWGTRAIATTLGLDRKTVYLWKVKRLASMHATAAE